MTCAANSTALLAQPAYDPFEGFNRGVFAFNRVVDGAFIKPAAQGYRFLVPEFGRDRVRDVLNNLTEPLSFFNALLQGEPEIAGNAGARFLINSTLGIGGLFDVAAYLEPPYARDLHQEDFGQTLAVWGWEDSAYFVIPLLGPSTVRDTGGLVVDVATSPWTWTFPSAASLGVTGARVVDGRESVLDLLDDLERTSLDFYASVRTVFLQNREFVIRNGEVGPRDDIFDEFDDLDAPVLDEEGEPRQFIYR